MADFARKIIILKKLLNSSSQIATLPPAKKLNSIESIHSNKIKVSKRFNYPNLLTALCVCLKECDFSVRYLCENTITQLKKIKKPFGN